MAWVVLRVVARVALGLVVGGFVAGFFNRGRLQIERRTGAVQGKMSGLLGRLHHLQAWNLHWSDCFCARRFFYADAGLELEEGIASTLKGETLCGVVAGVADYCLRGE